MAVLFFCIRKSLFEGINSTVIVRIRRCILRMGSIEPPGEHSSPLRFLRIRLHLMVQIPPPLRRQKKRSTSLRIVHSEQEGFGSLWCCRRRDRRQADVPRTSAFRWFKSLLRCDGRKTKPHPFGWGFVFLAEQEGFEPSVPFWGTHDFQSCPL